MVEATGSIRGRRRLTVGSGGFDVLEYAHELVFINNESRISKLGSLSGMVHIINLACRSMLDLPCR